MDSVAYILSRCGFRYLVTALLLLPGDECL